MDETIPTKLYVHEVKPDGVVARWNAEKGESEQIRPEQLICAVNSATTCKVCRGAPRHSWVLQTGLHLKVIMEAAK